MRRPTGTGARPLAALAAVATAAIGTVAVAIRADVHAAPAPLQRVVFASTGIAPGRTQIASANIDGTGVVNLSNSTSTDTGPRVSPDGKLIAFDRAAANLQSQAVYVMGIDGSHQTALTDPAGIAANPSWYPDGTQLVYDAGGQLWRINADGTGKQQLTHGSTLSTRPSVSADGSLIAYVATTISPNSVAIHVASAVDMSHDVALTDGGHFDANPVFGPPGTVLFDRGEDKPPAMLLSVTTAALAPAGRETALTAGAQPSYDPKANRIAFSAQAGGQFGLGVYDLTTHQAKVISTFPGDSFSFTLLAAPPPVAAPPSAAVAPPAGVVATAAPGLSALTIGIGILGVLLLGGGGVAWWRVRSGVGVRAIETIVREIIAADPPVTRDKRP
jgi:dipeptidyl aminopeptidase/acylaminoacyl peptidase